MGRIAAWGLAAVFILSAGGCAAWRRDQKSPESGEADLLARRELSRDAEDAAESEDWDAARSALDRLAVLDPNSAEVRQRLGQAWLEEGRPELAEDAFQDALENDPEYPSALIGLAESARRQGRLTEALKHLDEAVELDPERADAHRARGVVLEALGRRDDALAAYFRALSAEPGDTDSIRRAAALQLAGDRPEQALLRLDSLLDLTPDDAEARYIRGRTLLVLDRPGPAAEDLRAASERFPERPEVFYDLARATAETRPEEARRAAKRAQELAPAWAEARSLAERLQR